MPSRSGGTAGTDSSWSRLRALWERVGESLFYVPALFMAIALALSQGVVVLDRALEAHVLPAVFDSTVDSGRVLLSVIAGGTITAASVVFALTLVAVQLASTQFSPRTLGSFLGDRAQQIIIGLVLGTYVYCLLVLRVVRAPLEEGGSPFIPRFSVMVAVVLGVAAMVAVIASINRTAQRLRVESVAGKITEETMAAINDQFGDGYGDEQSVGAGRVPSGAPPSDAFVVEAGHAGWIQYIGVDRILEGVPERSHVMIHQSVGNYVVTGQRLVSVWPRPEDPDRAAEVLASAFVTGDQRSRHGDVSFGITRLVDIAARALSPGVNDPKTAEEIVLRLGEILVELAVRDLPPAESVVDGRTIIRAAELRHEDYVEAAIEPIRRFARNDPQVLSSILQTLATSKNVAVRRRPDAAVESLDRQAQLIVVDAEQLPTQSDRDLVIRTATAIHFD